jgi:hypothetical protein
MTGHSWSPRYRTSAPRPRAHSASRLCKSPRARILPPSEWRSRYRPSRARRRPALRPRERPRGPRPGTFPKTSMSQCTWAPCWTRPGPSRRSRPRQVYRRRATTRGRGRGRTRPQARLSRRRRWLDTLCSPQPPLRAVRAGVHSIQLASLRVLFLGLYRRCLGRLLLPLEKWLRW